MQKQEEGSPKNNVKAVKNTLNDNIWKSLRCLIKLFISFSKKSNLE